MSSDLCEENQFKSVFNLHGEYLRNFLFYKTGSIELSEDLLQESYIRLWENCADVTIEKAKSFLFTVANNLFLNKVKHDKVVLKFRANIESHVTHRDPQYQLEEEEFKQRLQIAISSLPENQRVVFLMNRIDKKKYREIAEELNISVKAVEKRMHKALVQLRQIHKKV